MPEHQEVEPEADFSDVRVLAVDPRRERRAVTRQMLEHFFQPAEIAEADSRESAIEFVGRYRPGVVVLEIQMPLEVALDTIDTLGRMTPRPRVVVCSFRHDPATVAAALDRGADAYVAKPAGSADLRVALGSPPERAVRPVRHRPPDERPLSRPPRRGREPTGTGATS